MINKEHSLAVKKEIDAMKDVELENKSEAIARLENIKKIKKKQFWQSCKFFKMIQDYIKYQ